MTTVLGAIADDFTGATDLAGLLARSGVRVSLRMGVPDGPPEDPAPFEVIALKIRTAQVDHAVAEARAALDWLQRAGAERFFWKYCSTFDSTPEGNIGPVAEALMQDLGADQTIYCPAFPENGRSIYMGNLFVGEQPLGESPMKDHPLTPMRDSNLMRLLAPQVTQAVGLANRLTVAGGVKTLTARLAELRAEGVAHVVVDAVANEDLHVIAEACRDMPLMTGGSAVAMPLPGLWQADGLLAQAGAPSRPQVGPGAVILDERGVTPAIDWLSGLSAEAAPLIYATADPASVRATQESLGAARAGEIVEEALAACALAARDMGRRRFVIAGGESSGAVTQALGVSRLDIGREIAPGVPWCFAESGGDSIALTLKSGNFGAESFFTDALDMLDQ